jgi:ferredoxin-type protein NapH
MLKRRITQFISTILYNAGMISDLPRRYMPSRFCVPGFNCQYCPASIAGCPLNYLQRLFSTGGRNFPVSSLAWFLLFCIALGRLICGWLCPFGLFQDLLDKAPFPKLKKGKVTRALSWIKYVVFFGIIVGLEGYLGLIKNQRILVFCRYICPNVWFDQILYTLLKGNSLDPFMLTSPPFIFLVFLVILSLFIFRPFCRFFCPLGVFYGFFNRFALFSIHVDESKCIHCQACMRVCPMDTKKVGDHECISCGKCKKVCHPGAIHFGIKNNVSALSQTEQNQ